METKQLILSKLLEKVNPQYKCPMCGNNNAGLLDGLLNNFVTDFKAKNSVQIGGNSVPVIMLACSKCGFISQHSVGIIFGGVDKYFEEVNNGADNNK